MLNAMRAKYKEGDLVTAAALAKDAAPYMHPRLAAVEQSGPDGGPVVNEVIYRWARPEESLPGKGLRCCSAEHGEHAGGWPAQCLVTLRP